MSLQIILQALHVSYCGPWPWQICAHVGNSLMLSGESGHNTAQSIPQNFFEQSGTEQRMWPGDTGPGANKWFLPRQPLKTPFQQPFVKGENNKSWQLRSKSILDICYGCWRVFIWHLVSWLLGRRFILWQTIPGDTEPESGEWRVSASHPEKYYIHLGLWAH